MGSWFEDDNGCGRGIRSKQKVSTDTHKLGEGSFGDVNWTNKRTMHTYKDSDIDLDVEVCGTNSIWDL